MSAAATQQKMVPELRFSGFGSEWKKRHIGDMFKVVVGFVGTVSTEYCPQDVGVPFVRTLNVKDGYFSQEELQYVTRDFHNRNKKSQIFNGDILIARVGANMGLVCEVTDLISEANSANVVIIKKNDELVSGFYSRYLSSDHGKKQTLAFGAGGAQEVLNIGVVKTMVVPEIELEEQQKIADFLGSVDAWLDNLRQQKTTLETYKKGMMQKLFTQQVRFKDDEGNDFPEWEEAALEDLLDYDQPAPYIVNSTEYDDSYDTPVLTAGKSFILGYTDEKDGIYDKHPVIIFDDFTTAIQYVDFSFKVKSSAMKILTTRKGADIRYVFAAMSRIKYEVGGHGRHWISKYSKLCVPLPSTDEQRRIADFLSSLDQSISDKAAEIEKVEQWKKGLMQKMFV